MKKLINPNVSIRKGIKIKLKIGNISISKKTKIEIKTKKDKDCNTKLFSYPSTLNNSKDIDSNRFTDKTTKTEIKNK